VVVLAALTGLAINTFADVQNIRISGDIRIRGYWLDNVDDLEGDDGSSGPDSFISQRTRVTIEADLEDHILVVVTLKAEGLWGTGNDADDSSGAGTETGSGNDAINRRWEAGFTEAYIQFSEMFYAPLTLKIGRQYLHYGRGLIISSIEQEYNYDAARLVLDYYPLTVDLVYAKLAENSGFGQGSDQRDVDLFFVNARYEFTDSILKNIEGYFGYIANNNNTINPGNRVPPVDDSGDSPFLVGARADVNITENFQTWAEAAYEFGSATSGENIEAWIGNVGGVFTFKDVQWVPAINANFTYASGGGADGEHQFRPWFDYQDGYNGYVFSPHLSNIMIMNAGVSVKPSENTSASVQAYYYMAVDDSPVGNLWGSNDNIDNGGIATDPSAEDEFLGWEVDGIFGYDYSKDVRFQLVYGVFIPGDAFSDDTSYGAAIAHEVRAEVNARF
jgi:hypothetical protein